MSTTAKAPPKPKTTYVETETGNKVARRNQIHGTMHIVLAGRCVIQSDVCIRGDFVRPAAPLPPPDPKNPPVDLSKPAINKNTSVTIGRYTFISSGCVLRPPARLHKGISTYIPMKIGEHTFFGPSCVVEAASIGDHCHFGRDVVVGRLCVIKDYVKVLEGSVLPMGMVVPSFSVVGGYKGGPARVLGEVGDGWGQGGEGVEGGDLRELWRGTG